MGLTTATHNTQGLLTRTLIPSSPVRSHQASQSQEAESYTAHCGETEEEVDGDLPFQSSQSQEGDTTLPME